MSTNKVVLVSERESLVSELASIAGEMSDLEFVDTARSAEQLGYALVEHDVHVVIVDAEFADMPYLELVRSVAHSHPSVGLLVATPEADQDLYGAAMEAGARGVLRIPLGLQEVQAGIDRTASWARALRAAAAGQAGRVGGGQGRVLALAGAKGGVGTSFLACMIAAHAGRRARVCVVDMDLRSGDIAYYSGVRAKRSVAELADVSDALTGRSISEVAVDSPAGYAVIAAPRDVERAEDVSGTAARQIVHELRRQFDLVVVDVGSRVEEAQATTLELADQVMIVVEPDIVSVRAARSTMHTWQRLSIRANNDVAVVLNKADRKREVQLELVRKVLQLTTAWKLPSSLPEIEAAVNTGDLTEVRSGPLSKAIGEVTDQLWSPGVHGPMGGAVRAEKPGRKGCSKRQRGRRSKAAGQATVELPLAVIIFVTAFLLCMQGLMLGASNVFAQHAANAAARELSVSPDRGDARAAAQDAVPGALGHGFSMTVDGDGTGEGSVRIKVDIPRLFPFIDKNVMQAERRASFQEEPR
ncbi:AAA family ATPase [Luteipulveratus halotolerans]|uniref:Response regulatory domain-containing protein n=1 Tax=Luteipulveratus halotolerans TaxID=1631356 RepID=A0A0L6CKN2_9MICO|nr:AAA family ATPase [Luteipulveratus halotolerans]KNX38356.1 hypothetical protein VV01_16310 [Luteipulveratus halotolerans]